MAGEPLGTARVDFVGDDTQLKKTAAEAVQTVQTAKAQMEGGAAGGGTAAPAAAAAARETTAEVRVQSDAIKESVSSAKSLVAVFRSLLGILGFVTLAIGAASSAVTFLIRKSEESTKAFKEQRDELEKLKTLSDDFLNPKDQYEKAIDGVRKEFQARDSAIRNDSKLSKDAKRKLLLEGQEEEARQIQAIEDKRVNDYKNAQEKIEQERKEAVANQVISQLNTAKARADADELAAAEGLDKIEIEYKQTNARIDADRAKTEDERVKRELDRQAQYAKEKYERELTEFENAHNKMAAQEDQDRREREDKDKASIAAVARAQEQAQQRVRDSAASMFPANDVAVQEGLSDITALVGAIAAQTGRIE